MSAAVFMNEEEMNVADLAKICRQETVLRNYSFASDVQKNILIYRGDDLLAAINNNKKAVLQELHLALSTGPGVIAIKGAYVETSILDRSNQVFDEIFALESHSHSGGDHFAAAGKNGRIWNTVQKVAAHNPEVFVQYYANSILALVCEAWLGPWYQMTAQVNVVHPGGKAQQPHRDYHLGFQENPYVRQFPINVQVLSQYLTLQGAIAHTDMPIESGSTQFLPYSQQLPYGYLAWRHPDFIKYFKNHFVQLELEKGDAVFFSPALFHAAGDNNTQDHTRIANLLQVSSAFGKPMETIDHKSLLLDIYPYLLASVSSHVITSEALDVVIAMSADGYSFPTNLDRDPPMQGLAPQTQQQLLQQALNEGWGFEQFKQGLEEQVIKRQAI